MADLGVGRRVRINEEGGRTPPPEKNVRGKSGEIKGERGSMAVGQSTPLTYVQLYEVVLDDGYGSYVVGADWLEPL